MLSIVHDMAEADVGDITPEHASGVSKETKLALEQARLLWFSRFFLPFAPSSSPPFPPRLDLFMCRKRWIGTVGCSDTLRSRA